MAPFLKPITGMGRESRLTQLKINIMSLIPKAARLASQEAALKMV